MRTILAALCISISTAASGQEAALSASDTTQSVVTAQKGKRVTLRLRSGSELTGTVRDANARLVVLGAVAGRELFDAIIPLETVEAVLIRTKQ